MWHLQDEELVGLVFAELPAFQKATCEEHLRTCSACAAAYEELNRAVAFLEKGPTQPVPPFAWARLKGRIERSVPRNDWCEPAWTPLILGNVAGMLLILVVIFWGGGWLEHATVWQSIRMWPLAAEVGPRGLTALFFFGAGAMGTLAMTPILWWESRRANKSIVK
jgi:anti-sigma factor RsiW